MNNLLLACLPSRSSFNNVTAELESGTSRSSPYFVYSSERLIKHILKIHIAGVIANNSPPRIAVSHGSIIINLALYIARSSIIYIQALPLTCSPMFIITSYRYGEIREDSTGIYFFSSLKLFYSLFYFFFSKARCCLGKVSLNSNLGIPLPGRKLCDCSHVQLHSYAS